jgi:hypothetical protein
MARRSRLSRKVVILRDFSPSQMKFAEEWRGKSIDKFTIPELLRERRAFRSAYVANMRQARLVPKRGAIHG